MAHVFISYSKQDIDFARYLRKLLNEQGFTVWLDESRLAPSSRWWTEIESNIQNCAALIVIMSPAARESDWVEREILYAERLEKPIFPVLLAGEYWPRLANLQHADMGAGLKATLPPMLASRLNTTIGPVSESPSLVNIPLPERVAPPPRKSAPSGTAAGHGGKARPRHGRRRLSVARVLIPLVILVIAAALVIAFDTRIDAWLFGERDSENSADDGGDGIAVRIIEPFNGREIAIHEGFIVRVEVYGVTHEMPLEIWVNDEMIDHRVVNQSTRALTLGMSLPEPHPFFIHVRLMDEERLVAEHGVEVFGVVP